MTRTWPVVLKTIGLTGLGGRQSKSSNSSLTPDDDPERHFRAGREVEDMVRRNQEAEAQFYRKLRARTKSSTSP
jgi:hypothetical protein